MSFLWPNEWPSLSAPLPDPKLRALSLGAGVQSTTLALATARGEVGPMPDVAIFSDTKWEPRKVRRHLDWLKTVLPFPVIEVSAGDLRADIIARRNTTGGRYASVPWFILNPDGSRGMGRRQCTKEYKLGPIAREVRQLLGVSPRSFIAPGSVEVWIGISMDEVVRMKPSRTKYMVNRWPLIEAGMDRNDCERWLKERQYSAPKSSCIGCPFHTNAMWRDMRDNEPEEWADAVAVDAALRSGTHGTMRVQEFMHKSCVPLDQAPIDIDDGGQFGLDLECEGMCGV